MNPSPSSVEMFARFSNPSFIGGIGVGVFALIFAFIAGMLRAAEKRSRR